MLYAMVLILGIAIGCVVMGALFVYHIDGGDQ
jgi:hypothetical protein